MDDKIWDRRDKIARFMARQFCERWPRFNRDDVLQEARLIALRLPDDFPVVWVAAQIKWRLVDLLRQKTRWGRRFRLEKKDVDVEQIREYDGLREWRAARRAQRVRDDVAIAVEKALVYADPKTKFAYQKYYGEGLKLTEIGELMGRNPQRVSQILGAFRDRVKKNLTFDR